MSNRTIIEINHDFVDAIRRTPMPFAERLWSALQCGADLDWEELRPWGIRRIVETHHSETRKVIVEGREYPVG